MKLKSMLLFFVSCFLFTCSKDEHTCEADDFTGIISGTWESATNECTQNLPTTFVLSTSNDPINTDVDVLISNADTIVFLMLFNGANEEGCLFSLDNPANSESIGRGILKEDELTLGFVDNNNNYICTFTGKLEN